MPETVCLLVLSCSSRSSTPWLPHPTVTPLLATPPSYFPLGPPPAGRAYSANFPLPVPDSPSPPASPPAAAVALAPARRGGAQLASQRKHWAPGGLSFLPPPALPVSPGCGGSWPPPLAADRRRGDGTGLGYGLEGLPGSLLLSDPPSQAPMPSEEPLHTQHCSAPSSLLNIY